MQVESEIYARVFLPVENPRTALPAIEVQFRRYANANAQIKLADGTLLVRMADTLAGAPDTVHEALAEILLSKLFRKPVPAASNDRYRRYLELPRRAAQPGPGPADPRQKALIWDIPGPVITIWIRCSEELNFRYFFGLMARPSLGWSRQDARTMLGHYDSSHNAIVLSRLLDRPETPQLAVESRALYHRDAALCAITWSSGARGGACIRPRSEARTIVQALSAGSESDAPQAGVISQLSAC